ncbi:hypothetical protein KC926_01110 [Candidatus Kaiserbacteria bacterium]|nr:hypothetical protein [Candidatus Kaiserbacteria bacterium]
MSAYLLSIVDKYKPRDLTPFQIYSIPKLKTDLTSWASSCFVEILDSGSRAKGTAISLASDVDYMVSLTSGCNQNSGGLESIFNSLYTSLNAKYSNCRRQNVSVRIKVSDLEIDITPARKQPGSVNDHWIYLSKTGGRQQTNIKRHISDVSTSGRLKEIMLCKIWRERHGLDFPSIYLEYLLINHVLLYRSKGDSYLESNFAHILREFSKDVGNPLFSRVIDPANSSNILSDLLTTAEKNRIVSIAKKSDLATNWGLVVW